MTRFEAATSALGQVLSTVENAALPDDKVADLLTNALAPLADAGLGLELEVRDSHGTLAHYSTPTREPADPFTHVNDPQGAVSFAIDGTHYRSVAGFDPDRNRSVFNDLVALSFKILKTHWRARCADTLVVRRQESGQDARIEKPMRDAATDGRSLAVAYLDLDRFKEINDGISHAVGDAVLREFGSRLRKAFAADGTVVRTGGEEFAIAWQGRSLGEVLPRLEEFRRTMQSEPFLAISEAKVNETNPVHKASMSAISDNRTCCIGLAVLPRPDLPGPASPGYFSTLYNLAEAAGARAKQEGRNCIRIASSDAGSDVQQSAFGESDIICAALWARQCLLKQQLHPFGDELHGYLARDLGERFENVHINELTGFLAAAIRTLGLRTRALPNLLNYEDSGASPVIHPVKLASIVLHSLFKLTLAGKGPLRADDKLHLKVQSESATKYLSIEVARTDGTTADVQVAQVINAQPNVKTYAGQPWTDRINSAGGIGRWVPIDGVCQVLSPCLLLAIGAQSLTLGLQHWVAATVQVDDRPVTGGGLPDFWQSNLSRLVHAVLANPNIRSVLVAGDITNARRTAQYITDSTVLAEPGLAARINVDEQALHEFRDRRLSNSIVDADGEAALRATSNLYFGRESQLTAIGTARNLREEYTRRRRLMPAVPSDAEGLKAADGLRCDSLADAYPRVLRLLRSLDGPEWKDHMGRRFHELLGFKLVLERPLDEPVPDYWRQEAIGLDEYYNAQFMSETGLFGQRLRHWGNVEHGVDQVAHAVRNALDAIRGGIATRRIIQFIAQPTDDRDKPLGLVCVQVVPRENQGKWVIDFQWVWRTVEALVGFPFSANGSIRFSQHFLEEVNRELAAHHLRAAMGRLTYLALSLHVFLGEGDEEIARTVVTDAYV